MNATGRDLNFLSALQFQYHVPRKRGTPAISLPDTFGYSCVSEFIIKKKRIIQFVGNIDNRVHLSSRCCAYRARGDFYVVIIQ